MLRIDGGLSWQEWDASKREDLILIARCCGIAMIRRAVELGIPINSGRGVMELGDGGAGYEAIGGVLPQQRWLPDSGDGLLRWPCPRGSAGWRSIPRDRRVRLHLEAKIGRHLELGLGRTGGLETSPTSISAAILPADQVRGSGEDPGPCASSRASEPRWLAGSWPFPIGIFARPWRPGRGPARSGRCLFSFHPNYDKATALEGIAQGLSRIVFLHQSAHPTGPLWLTECGHPWKRRPRSPSPYKTRIQISALDITMKGVESLACGIARYFPFVYPYYEENTNNFSMMGRRLTPRSFASYAQMIRVLARHRDLGDLRHSSSALQRARLFGDDQEVIAVLYSGRPDESTTVALGLPVERIEGIDGRRLHPGNDGSIPIPDGLSYVWINRAAASSRLITDTAASRTQPGPGKFEGAQAAFADRAPVPARRSTLSALIARLSGQGCAGGEGAARVRGLEPRGP